MAVSHAGGLDDRDTNRCTNSISRVQHDYDTGCANWDVPDQSQAMFYYLQLRTFLLLP